jgi:hypothetical protein
MAGADREQAIFMESRDNPDKGFHEVIISSMKGR